MSEGSGSSSCKPQSVSSSVVNGPLVSEVDESPLQKAMDKNKECKYAKKNGLNSFYEIMQLKGLQKMKIDYICELKFVYLVTPNLKFTNC